MIKEKINKNSTDFMPINGTDHVEFYVGNAKQAAHFYKTAFGFQSLAYSGLETGLKDRESYVVAQDKIRLVLTSPLKSGTDIGRHIDQHGDGVKVVAFWVDDATYAYETAIKNGAKSYFTPKIEKDDQGEIIKSGIYTYGETVHVFIERKNYNGVFMPGYRKWETPDYNPFNTGLKFVDHMVGNVGWNKMDVWVSFYQKVLGFSQILSFDDEDISTDYTALMSKVMSNGNGRIKFPINEPAEGKKKSQVEEFLDFYEGEGIQHIALYTEGIVKTVIDSTKIMLYKKSGFYGDSAYTYSIGEIDEETTKLKELNILVDSSGAIGAAKKRVPPILKMLVSNDPGDVVVWKRKL